MCLQLEGVDITQPWLTAQSLAMAAANRPGPEFGREHSPKVALSPQQETELSPRPRIKRTYPSRIDRTDSLRIERTYPSRIERTYYLTPERTVKTNSEQISGARLDDFMSADRSFGATREAEWPSERTVAERHAVLQQEFKGEARDSSSDAESVAPDRPRRDVTEGRVTSRTEQRTEADCGTRAPPGHPSASRREAVNTSLDTTVPVMEVPLASSSSGVIDFPRRGNCGGRADDSPGPKYRVTAGEGADWYGTGDSRHGSPDGRNVENYSGDTEGHGSASRGNGRAPPAEDIRALAKRPGGPI